MNTSTISPERSANLRKLAELMNTRHKNPFPITDPLLSCYDLVLASEEIDFLLKLGTEPYSYEKAASLTSLPESEFREFFEVLVGKGFIWPYDSPDSAELYVLPGIMLGWFEVFLSGGEETPEKREFARRTDMLLKSYGKMNTFPLRGIMNRRSRKAGPHQSILIPGSSPERGKGRTISVGKTVDSEPARVYPAGTVEELIERQGDGDNFAVVHCFCRQYHKMIEQPCRFEQPPQSCIAFGSLGRYAVKHGKGRSITKSEAISLVRELQAKGAVHQVFHKNEDVNNPELAICNCCWDCCGVLGSYNRGIIPLNFHSYFEAQLPDSAKCSGCATCVDFCPVQAITMVNEKCAIDSAKCIGCGQCELQCPEDAICMIENERKVFLPLIKKSEARIKD
ncbi:MAG: 4Fe-4S binding protein [Acidobacteria bacterium]|nr:4Fe-4S binding protein [Acidobacteriota bacterium]